MINALQSELTINVLASIIVSLLFLALGFVWGKYKERRRKFGRNLEEYDFYPFTVTRRVNRAQSTNLDTTVACILTRRSDQGGTRLHKAKAFQIIADPSISAASTSLRQKNTVVLASSTIMGCQDFLTDPYCYCPWAGVVAAVVVV